MDVVRELRRKQDDLRCDRQALADKMAEINDQIAAFDTVIQAYEPGHLPAKKKPRQSRKRGNFLDGLFAGDNLNARILNTLRLAQTPISSHECATRVALQKGVAEDDPRISDISGRVSIQLSNLARNNRVEQIKGDGRASLWRIAA